MLCMTSMLEVNSTESPLMNPARDAALTSNWYAFIRPHCASPRLSQAHHAGP